MTHENSHPIDTAIDTVLGEWLADPSLEIVQPELAVALTKDAPTWSSAAVSAFRARARAIDSAAAPDAARMNLTGIYLAQAPPDAL